MKRMLLVFGMSIVLCFSSIGVAFADTEGELPDGTITDEITVPGNEDSTAIQPNSSHFRTLKEHTGTSTGTKYNDKKTKKADYTLKHYRVYQQNIATGVKHLKYKLTEWSWTGYKKQNGKWVKKKKKSGSNREHLDPMSLLNGYLFP